MRKINVQRGKERERESERERERERDVQCPFVHETNVFLPGLGMKLILLS